MKKTALYENHLELGGKIIDFGGWAMPVQYSSIIKEHKAVREEAGIFDVSHMGEILVSGPDSREFLQFILTNDLSSTKGGRALYSPMCYEDGGIVDDLLVYMLSDHDYLLVVNASNTKKDYEWLKNNQANFDVNIEDKSLEYGLLALQGPKSLDILKGLVEGPLEDLRFFRFSQDFYISGIKVLISRTGYTGEDGFEIYTPWHRTAEIWELILDKGRDEGLTPAGLGARDTLRFEASLPLYGQELGPDISPLEADLGRFVKFDKGRFIGREDLLIQREEGLGRKLIGFKMLDRGIARTGHRLMKDGTEIGQVTSGSISPSLGLTLGLGFVQADFAEVSRILEVEIRSKLLRVEVIERPFYKR